MPEDHAITQKTLSRPFSTIGAYGLCLVTLELAAPTGQAGGC